MSDPPPVRVGVSACLLGQEVRYDGGHKRQPFLVEELAPHVELVPVCPEVEVGMGVPRETVHLVRADDGVRMEGTRSKTDHTAAMAAFAARRVAELTALGLSGYVFKARSPSCGLDVAVAGGEQAPGLFAAALVAAAPTLPVAEEGDLDDPSAREGFVVRLFAHARLETAFAEGWSVGDLVRFHTGEKLLLMAHHQATYRSLGKLVAGAKGASRDELEATYRRDYAAALRRPATVGAQVNVLQHVQGYFKGLDEADRAAIGAAIEAYRTGEVPFAEPLGLLRRHATERGVAYLLGQVYLVPSAAERALRGL